FSRQLRLGDRYEIRDLQDYFGPPILSGIYNGKPLQLPMNIGGKSGPEFNAFELISNSIGGPAPPAPSPSPFPSRPSVRPSRITPPLPQNRLIDLGNAIPLDDEERALLNLINNYRLEQGRDPLGASVSLTYASDWTARDMAAREYTGKKDSLGRTPKERARAFGYPGDSAAIEEDSLSGLGELDAQQIFDLLKSSSADPEMLLNPFWKNVGIARALNPKTNQWYWNVSVGSCWDQTIPMVSGDDSGRIDRSVSIPIRSPSRSLLANRRIVGDPDQNRPQDLDS